MVLLDGARQPYGEATSLLVGDHVRIEPQRVPDNPFVPEFAQPLRETDVDLDPLRQFAVWYVQAAEAGVRAPEAAALATASADAVPSVRIVLVKHYDERGFQFYTNYGSRKGRELTANPRGALLFHWDTSGRQVRIEGRVDRVSPEENAAYVRSRPPGSQLSALASPQSRPIDSREELERRVAQLAAEHRDRELPLPSDWGGFRLIPRSFEFWQHREDRLHDRLLYTRAGDGSWRLQRLAP
jgi:pyridoxamine 5'-phosphate oxidase